MSGELVQIDVGPTSAYPRAVALASELFAGEPGERQTRRFRTSPICYQWPLSSCKTAVARWRSLQQFCMMRWKTNTFRPATPGVYYLAEQGEASALAARSADMVTVAQAYHWLDHPRFHAEVDRVLAPGGAFAVWCYGVLHVEPEIEAAMARFYDGTVGAYWPKERVHVERGYRHFTIPIAEVPAPPMSITTEFTLPQLLGYVRTWSAVGRYMKANGHDPVPEFGQEFATLWVDPDRPRRVEWPISVRAGRWIGSGSAAA